MSEKKLVGIRSETITTENCEACDKLDGFYNDLSKELGESVKFDNLKLDAGSEEGKKYITEHHLLDDNQEFSAPNINLCKIYDDQSEDCQTITGFNESELNEFKKSLNLTSVETQQEQQVEEKTE